MKRRIKCTVCGKRFTPEKEAVYQATEKVSAIESFSKIARIIDVIDCPNCGCQHMLKIRMPVYEEDEHGIHD